MASQSTVTAPPAEDSVKLNELTSISCVDLLYLAEFGQGCTFVRDSVLDVKNWDHILGVVVASIRDGKETALFGPELDWVAAHYNSEYKSKELGSFLGTYSQSMMVYGGGQAWKSVEEDGKTAILFEECSRTDFDVFSSESILAASLLGNSGFADKQRNTDRGLFGLLLVCKALIERGSFEDAISMAAALNVFTEPFYRLIALFRRWEQQQGVENEETWQNSGPFKLFGDHEAFSTWDWVWLKSEIDASGIIPALNQFIVNTPDSDETKEGKDILICFKLRLEFGQTLGHLQASVSRSDIEALDRENGAMAEANEAIAYIWTYFGMQSKAANN